MNQISKREIKELQSLFADPRYVREAFKSVGVALLQNPATRSPEIYDKNGMLTGETVIAQYSYDQLARDIKEIYKQDRAPTQLEMIMMCQMVKARYDTSAAVFVRDTLGARPIDESRTQVVQNDYENLSDDELEMLARYRAAQNAVPADSPDSVEANAISPDCHSSVGGSDDTN